jgi:hypothetical protein
MTVRRVGCLLAIAVMLAALGPALVPHPAEARAEPVAQIDIRGLLGDENEPDENEGGEAGGGQSAQGSGTSLPVVLLLMALAAIAGAYAAMRVRRLVLRVRGWGRDMRARL